MAARWKVEILLVYFIPVKRSEVVCHIQFRRRNCEKGASEISTWRIEHAITCAGVNHAVLSDCRTAPRPYSCAAAASYQQFMNGVACRIVHTHGIDARAVTAATLRGRCVNESVVQIQTPRLRERRD